MFENKRLIMMVGLPYSGKSTRAREMGYPIVNPDSIRMSMGLIRKGEKFTRAGFDKNLEPYVWAITETMIKSLFHAGHWNVILDATNITKERRDKWLSLGCKIDYIVMNVQPEESKRRARELGDELMVGVIEDMNAKYESVKYEKLTNNVDLNMPGGEINND